MGGENTFSVNSNLEEVDDERFISVVQVQTESGIGTGFFIKKDHIITNFHVVEYDNEISVKLYNGKTYSAKAIKKDPRKDLALLKVNTNTGVPVTFYNDKIRVGTEVEAIGHPEGYDYSITRGIISSVRKEETAVMGDKILMIQTDAALNHGNSGGPLYYDEFVVGVNTQGLSKDTTEGLNFAIHLSELELFLR